MLIKILLLLFVLFALSRIFSRLYKEEITKKEFFIWLIFWLLVGGAVIWPKTTDIIAGFVGVSRGADLLVYISILVIFFIVFKIIVKLEKIDREITKIIRELSLRETKEKNQKS